MRLICYECLKKSVKINPSIQEMLEPELDAHLGYEDYERSDNPDYRNGVKLKKLRNSYGEITTNAIESLNAAYAD